MTPAVIALSAAINGALTLGVFFTSRRSITGAVVAVMLIGVAYSFLWSGSPRHSTGEVFWNVGLPAAAITWLPGAIVASVGGRLRGRLQQVLGSVAVLVGIVLGAGFIATELSLTCSRLGDCL